MLREALEFLAEQARQSVTPTEIKSPDPARRIFLMPDRTLKTIDVGSEPRNHKVNSLEDLMRLATRFGPDLESNAEDSGDHPVVWYNENRIVLVIDDELERQNTATLNLVESDQFQTIRRLAKEKTAHDQAGFVRLLRIDLAGTLAPSVLLDPIRRVTFENGAMSQGVVERGKESLDRSVKAKVTGHSDIPEDVTLMVPVFKTPGERNVYPVRCVVDINPMSQSQAFRLIPLPDEIDRVVDMHMSDVRSRLEALPESVPAYYGAP